MENEQPLQGVYQTDSSAFGRQEASHSSVPARSLLFLLHSAERSTKDGDRKAEAFSCDGPPPSVPVPEVKARLSDCSAKAPPHRYTYDELLLVYSSTAESLGQVCPDLAAPRHFGRGWASCNSYSENLNASPLVIRNSAKVQRPQKPVHRGSPRRHNNNLMQSPQQFMVNPKGSFNSRYDRGWDDPYYNCDPRHPEFPWPSGPIGQYSPSTFSRT